MPRFNRILVVEDEALMAHALVRELKRAGFEVRQPTSTAESAIEIVQKERPHLVVMDIHLDGKLDGLEAAKKIRERHGMPIVFLSGYIGKNMNEKVKQIDNASHVIKPIDFKDFVRVVEKVIAEHYSHGVLPK